MKRFMIILGLGSFFFVSPVLAKNAMFSSQQPTQVQQINSSFFTTKTRPTRRALQSPLFERKFGFGNEATELRLGKLHQPFILEALTYIFLYGIGYAGSVAGAVTVFIGNIVAMAQKRGRLGWGIAGIVVGIASSAFSGVLMFSEFAGLFAPTFAIGVTSLALGIANVVLHSTSKRRYGFSPFVMRETNGGVAGGLSFLGKF